MISHRSDISTSVMLCIVECSGSHWVFEDCDSWEVNAHRTLCFRLCHKTWAQESDSRP